MAFSTFTPLQMAQAAMTLVATTIYTVPASTRSMVKSIDIANTTAGAMTVTVHLVPSGGTAAASNILIPAVPLSGNSILHWEGVQVMHTGGFISVVASVLGSTITISGAEGI